MPTYQKSWKLYTHPLFLTSCLQKKNHRTRSSFRTPLARLLAQRAPNSRRGPFPKKPPARNGTGEIGKTSGSPFTEKKAQNPRGALCVASAQSRWKTRYQNLWAPAADSRHPLPDNRRKKNILFFSIISRRNNENAIFSWDRNAGLILGERQLVRVNSGLINERSGASSVR